MHSSSIFDDRPTRSAWMRTPMPSGGGEIPDDGATVDVCVIGAGIAGLTTAYELVRRGFGVLLLEGRTIGGGESVRTSAHLASALDDRFTALERRHGSRGARILVSAHATAIDWIERFCRERAVDCGFRRVDGYLHESTSLDAIPIEDELQASRRAGLSVELVEAAGLPPMGGPRALRYGHQAELDAGEYLRALATAVIEAGVVVCESAFVETVEPGEPSTIVLQGDRRISARHVVCATNTPIVGGLAMSLRQAPYRSYVIALEIPKGVVGHALHWDMEEPYHYVRLAEADDASLELLVVGGEDHKVGQEDEPATRFARLEAWARERFPEARAVAYRWSGQILEPADGVGFVGRPPGAEASVYFISGDSGNGLTLGTLGGLLVADLLEGIPNEWAEVFDPARSATRGFFELARENANVAKQYLDLVRAGDVPDTNEIPPGHGAVVRDGIHLVAVYRDDAGQCHARSALCTHLDGVVRWNEVEGTWDCPCHGSRFDRFGGVITGPATEPLGRSS